MSQRIKKYLSTLEMKFSMVNQFYLIYLCGLFRPPACAISGVVCHLTSLEKGVGKLISFLCLLSSILKLVSSDSLREQKESLKKGHWVKESNHESVGCKDLDLKIYFVERVYIFYLKYCWLLVISSSYLLVAIAPNNNAIKI